MVPYRMGRPASSFLPRIFISLRSRRAFMRRRSPPRGLSSISGRVDRLAVGDDGQRLHRRPRQPHRLDGEQLAHPGGTVRAGSAAASRRPPRRDGYPGWHSRAAARERPPAAGPAEGAGPAASGRPRRSWPHRLDRGIHRHHHLLRRRIEGRQLHHRGALQPVLQDGGLEHGCLPEVGLAGGDLGRRLRIGPHQRGHVAHASRSALSGRGLSLTKSRLSITALRRCIRVTRAASARQW